MRKSLSWQACALGLLSLGAASAQPAKWRLQYSYDQIKTELQIRDLAMPSAKRGIAIGTIQDDRGGSRKNVAVVTSDGGEHWEITKVDEQPETLFFLNDTLGWMVTEKGLWHTEEAGKEWKKLPKPPVPVVRVFFVDENTGWAACLKKTVLVTHDGGHKWETVKASQELPGSVDRSAYTWISFATRDYGIVLGFNQPVPRWGSPFPAWMDPEDALTRRDAPHLAYTLVTRDQGKTWKGGSTSLFGQITRARFIEKGPGLGLIEMGRASSFPSEVYELDWHTGKNQTVFRDKRYYITDVWLTPSGTYYLAGVEVVGQVRSIAPGPVKVFKSTDRRTWSQMPVDYRAVAQRATLSGVGEDDLWLATDNGMILKLK
ncbi:MAG: hypothetical protein ABI759_22565 [Candidatus Solibacter sp.]